MMPLQYMPKIVKMVLIHRQAKEVDDEHMRALKTEVRTDRETKYAIKLTWHPVPY